MNPSFILAFDPMLDNQHLLQLQLELNNVLLGHTHRDDFGIALAQVLNKSVPCERFMLRISSDPTQLGYRLPLMRIADGSFVQYEDVVIMDQYRSERRPLRDTAEAIMDNPGIYQGELFKALTTQFPVFAEAAQRYNMQSLMALTFKSAEESKCLLLLANEAAESFKENQYELMQLLMPQIKLAFDNLIKYEKLRYEEEKRKMQLDLNNVLLMHTNREDFGKALAQVINKVVSCERFILRTWTGPMQLGYRLPLVRKANGTFERFSDLILMQQAQEAPEKMMESFHFVAEQPGVYQGDDMKKLCDRFHTFRVASTEFGVNSAMALSFNTIDTSCLLVLANSKEFAFEQEQYELLQSLMPQIILAFVNLFKYEKLKQEELERKAQVGIMAAFNTQKDLDQMALDAIAKLDEFIPFDYWFNITTLAISSDITFRMAVNDDKGFYAVKGDDIFKRILLDPIPVAEFKSTSPDLFAERGLYVGEAFDELRSSNSFFEACHRALGINSIGSFPLPTSGEFNTIVMMASKTKYAFTVEDMDAMERTIPYISIVAQQYFSLLHIQNLTNQLELEKNYLVEEIKSNFNFDEIIAGGPLMQEVFRQMSKVAPTDSTVLVLGETGTGKELIARGIHNQSPRKEKVLVKVNCASLPAQLIESELFGHEKGSFTGAIDKRIGKFELANGGTIFLDEIGELPLELQAKLLRVLQEREIERIGGKATIPLDVRIIAATNRDLESEVDAGKFRRDLFYRLNVFPISLPALRDRKEDIPLLAKHFLEKFCKKFGRPFKGVKRDLIEELMAYHWPGNIREMENVLEHSVIVGEESGLKLKRKQPVVQGSAVSAKQEIRKEPIVQTAISDDEIMRVLSQTKGKIVGPSGAAQILKMRPAQIEEVERKRLIEVLKKTNGRIRGEDGAANLLGLNATTLEARLKKLGIERKQEFG